MTETTVPHALPAPPVAPDVEEWLNRVQKAAPIVMAYRDQAEERRPGGA